MLRFKFFIVAIVLSLFCFTVAASSNTTQVEKERVEKKVQITQTLQQGSQVFWQRCVICHGEQGMGEGIIPLKIKHYPNTNLAIPNKTVLKSEIQNVILKGVSLKTVSISEFMPPMENELTEFEVAAVSEFILLLRSNSAQAITLLDQQKRIGAKSIIGAQIYETRCTLCHGKSGVGDGRMARIIKSPPPYDLTQSIMPPEYLKLIIAQGGGAMGRSPQMPPWEGQLSKQEINAVVEHLLKIRSGPVQ